MNKNQSFLVLCFLTTNAFAALFGPSNYDECILDKMKGQSSSLLTQAKNACEISFPIEKLLDTNMWSVQEQKLFHGHDNGSADITYKYKATTNELLDIEVKNNSKYKVTKINVITKSTCDKKYTMLDDVEVAAPIIGNTYTVKVANTKKIQCIDVLFYGIKIK
jgi:hypothetical protein